MAIQYNDSNYTYNSSLVRYDGDLVGIPRTATGTGTGTGTATGVRIAVRTATGTGTGTSTATYFETLPRTATGTGTGTGTATGVRITFRTATGSGSSTETATRLRVVPRTANSSGAGTQTASGLHIAPRTATGSGTGTGTATYFETLPRTATGTGTGSSTPTNWTKSLIFRTPTNNEIALNGFDVDIPWTEEVRVANSLLKFYRPLPRGINVYKRKNGVYTEREPLPDDIDIIYFGGHDNFVTPEEKQNLVAAGYTVT